MTYEGSWKDWRGRMQSRGNKLHVALCITSVIIWGWYNALLPVALIIVSLLLSSQLVSWRWRIVDSEFNRIADLTAVIVLISAIYLYSRYTVHGLYEFLRWLPVYFILLISSQWFSECGRIPMNALVLSLRRSKAAPQYFDFSYAYLLLCLFSAAASPERHVSLYFFIAMVVLGVLWSRRSRRFAVWVATSQLVIILVLGYVGHQIIFYSHQNITNWVLDWLSGNWQPDESQSVSTAIGRLGQLKLSERILFRVFHDKSQGNSILLRQGVYSLYNAGKWYSTHSDYAKVLSTDKKNWILTNSTPQTSLRISGLQGGANSQLLPIPNGTVSLHNLDTIELRKNDLQVVMAKDSAGFLDFSLKYSQANSRRAPHGADLLLPKSYTQLMDKIKSQLDLDRVSDINTRMEMINKFFTQGFRYSLVQEKDLGQLMPLATFLLKSKKGHCEYYATAGVLLLRAAGIPSRYVTGYLVQEYDPWEKAYVVRQRHAHAWIEAFVQGEWRIVDYTPAIWAELEAAQASWWVPLYDWMSRSLYWFNRWRWSDSQDIWSRYGLWVILLLSAVLIWRLRNKQRITVDQKVGFEEIGQRPNPVLDIVYRLEDHNPRLAGETLQTWLNRSEFRGKHQLQDRIIPLYYQSRYNPKGLSNNSKQRLQQEIDAWLEQYMSPPS